MALGAMLSGFSTEAQTKVTISTSTNAGPTPLSSPMIQPDTLQPNSAGTAIPQGDDTATRINRKQHRKNRSKADRASAPDTSSYRREAVGNGTALNNSNTTNYNSQNAVAPATGVNAVPVAGERNRRSGGAGTANGSVSTGSTMGTPTRAGSSVVATAPTPSGVADPDRQGTKANRSKTLSVGDFIAGSPNYTTLQNALQTATLTNTLKSTGPFTVFAPSNEAFKKLPAQTQKVLLEGRNFNALKTFLSYHVVAGEVDAPELMRRIRAGGGQTALKTIAGNVLTAKTDSNGQIVLTDEEGSTAHLEATDFYQTNGVVHGVDSVLLPKGGAALFH